MLVVVSSTVKTSRFDAKASQTMNTIRMTAVSEMKEPIDDNTFHSV